jgi:adenosylhomocysteine nucleosidase
MPDRFSSDRTLVDAARTAQTREGLVVSADAFVTARIVDEVRARFPQALSTDMESAAINQVATAFAVPFVSIRGVSDLCGPAADADHATHVDDAADRSANAVLAMLAAL